MEVRLQNDLWFLVEAHAYTSKCIMRWKGTPQKEKVKALMHNSRNFLQCLESLMLDQEVRESESQARAKRVCD